MQRFFNAFFRNTGLVKDPAQRRIASRVSALTVEGAVVFSLLGTMGVDMSPLITAAGVTGATVGFACKDFGTNFVASIALSGQPCLREGNKVTIGTGTAAVTGTIVDWDTRYLYLRNDKKHILNVPNSLILNSVVFWENPEEGAPVSPKTTPGEDAFANDKEWKAQANGASSSEHPTDGTK